MIREFTLTDVLYLIAAMRWTLALTAIAFLGGGIVGLTIALCRVSAFAPLRWLGAIYVHAVQGTPLLAWLFVFFFGLSPVQIFRYVVIFPALRLMYPSLASQFVLLMLATSVVSQISATDLFHMASIIQSRTFRDFEVYVVVAGAYLALALVFRLLFAGLYQLVFARPKSSG